MVLDALAAPVDPALDALLGAERAQALRDLLRDRARGWASAAAASGTALTATSIDELPGLLAGHDGPVLLIAPDVPGLGPAQLTAAREDLAAGVLLTIAPATDGHPYLLALARPDPRLLAVAAGTFEELVGAAHDLGGGVGMLRAERRLGSPGDAAALAADPLAPADLRALIAVAP